MIKVFATKNMHYTPFNGFHKSDLPFLKESGVEMVQEPKMADVIVSQQVKQLKPYFRKYFNTKKYLIWTLEPRYNIHPTSIKKVYLGLMKINIMNVYTGDVFASPLSFHAGKIDRSLRPISEEFTFSNKTLVGLMSFYKGLNTEEIWYKGEDVDLIKKRTAIALYGHEKGLMHVYGKGWPEKMSREDSRDGDWVNTKTGILEPYHFNLAFENTVAPRYTTEKIWDSIANYCLPIYYGAGTNIYDLFPENSFIDYSKMNNPEKLFNFIQDMSEAEFIRRMNKCIKVYNKISDLSIEEKLRYRKKSLNSIIMKLHQIN
ncbi:MAG: glycosyltransferase family 10 domain-containing protein [Nonlabens sp.]|uniref:glycosyltransferase family 10 domain-containing protein n=1 Tax=Nonlabens sp. TaxID=1888209 RepID=UPI003EF98672